MSHACPICRTPLPPLPRYPRYVCETCTARAASADGRRLEFGNVGLSGGYEACYADTGEPYASHACWIDGIACLADEARFGGIVIELDNHLSRARA